MSTRCPRPLREYLEVCREGLRRLDIEQRIVERIVALGDEGMASGVAEGFDIDCFIDEMGTETDPS